MDWSRPRSGALTYAAGHFPLAKAFMFRMWCEWAAQREAVPPPDLSGACKYGSLLMCRLFGGSIRGHYQHQYNDIDGLHLDLSHDAADVAAMRDPYLHEPLYFAIPEGQQALQGCLPRVDAWVLRYLDERLASPLCLSSGSGSRRHADRRA
ncbi:hypothetical protein C7444_11470 [Sphaerotilus hippei]|uniref:Uncharacterized protein n=1 Tax=Sphaerotilus hippei TaxID=744406 RepID=A0A318H8L0_9BURK|nr:transcriptional regulator [Sphaerotilus hippei]PXW94371.1 hypothetical protein C7444_11470 [Sphaerotilus hippei]